MTIIALIQISLEEVFNGEIWRLPGLSVTLIATNVKLPRHAGVILIVVEELLPALTTTNSVLNVQMIDTAVEEFLPAMLVVNSVYNVQLISTVQI